MFARRELYKLLLKDLIDYKLGRQDLVDRTIFAVENY